ncbi:MAG: hypothetical protein JXB38_21495 [Anaerolineales bacterium]|nr:hypothetical protein [Anaerolineales bacterium]
MENRQNTTTDLNSTIPQIRDELGAFFGALDNEIAKWTGQETRLQAFFPPIQAALTGTLGTQAEPVQTFHTGVADYTALLVSLHASGEPAEVIAVGVGFLNWRMYLLLNSFLLAVQEAAQKFSPAEVEKIEAYIRTSYYTPYFFTRLVIDTGDVLNLLAQDIQQLDAAPHDKRGLLVAMRIKKGLYATLIEEYCPTHPLIYYFVSELNSGTDNARIENIAVIRARLTNLQTQIRRLYAAEISTY